MKDMFKKHKKKVVLFFVAAVVYGAAQYLGIDIPLDQLLSADVSEMGEALEAGASE